MLVETCNLWFEEKDERPTPPRSCCLERWPPGEHQCEPKFIVKQYDDREQLHPMKIQSRQKTKTLRLWACWVSSSFWGFRDVCWVLLFSRQAICQKAWSSIWLHFSFRIKVDPLYNDFRLNQNKATNIRQKEEQRNIISATRDTFCMLKICLQFYLEPASQHKQTILRSQD